MVGKKALSMFRHLSASTVGRVLLQLSDGALHSGTAIGGRLGVSRATIGKAVQTLRSYGLPVQASPRQGYRIPGGYEPLDSERISVCADALGVRLPPVETEFVVSSTNELLKDRRTAATNGTGAAGAIAVEGQTGGRGRRGRFWSSPLGGLYLSLGWDFPPLMESPAPLGIAVAVETAMALGAMGAELQVKWPNDLLVDGGKVGGILTELVGEPAGPCYAVVGVGINLNVVPEVADVQAIPPRALSPRALGASRNEVFAVVLVAVARALMTFQQEGFAPFQRVWDDYDALFQRRVSLIVEGGEEQGVGCGIDCFGRLRLDCDGEERRFVAGETRLRATP